MLPLVYYQLSNSWTKEIIQPEEVAVERDRGTVRYTDWSCSISHLSLAVLITHPGECPTTVDRPTVGWQFSHEESVQFRPFFSYLFLKNGSISLLRSLTSFLLQFLHKMFTLSGFILGSVFSDEIEVFPLKSGYFFLQNCYKTPKISQIIVCWLRLR